MRKIIVHYGLIIPAILFVLHQIGQLLVKVSMPFFDNYLDPFCASVVVLHALSIERMVIFDQKLTWLDILVALLVLSICSEVLFPYFSTRFTADYLDLIAIILGGVWFIFTRRDLITKEYEIT